MFARAVRVARVRGVEVRLDPSLALIVLLVGWTLTVRFGVDRPLAAAIAMAAAATVLFFLSLLAHELGHAFEARHRGLQVDGITLFLFGGVTEMHAASETPRDEFVVAAVGPYVSLVCGAVFGLLATMLGDLPGATAAAAAEVAGLLGWLNVLLAVFNLVPGAPLDGGRVLRAGLWWLTGDRSRALRIAGRAGQVLGIAVAVYGLVVLTDGGIAGFVGAFWWLVIGGFLFAAARSELRQHDLEVLLDDNDVEALLAPIAAPVTSATPLSLVADTDEHGDLGDLLVVIDDARLVGVIPRRDLAAMHATARELRVAGDLADPIDDRPVVELSDPIQTLITRLRDGADIVRIEAAGQPLAAVTERDVVRALRRLRTSGHRPGDAPTPVAVSTAEPYGPPPADGGAR